MSTATKTRAGAMGESIYGAHITGQDWPVERAYRYCEQLARSHYENFPVGSVLVPKRLRKHFCAIYAFARTADDFADEGYAEGHTQEYRLALLGEWGEMLRQSLAGSARHPIFVALAETMRLFDLPVAPFEDLISAFSQDVVKRRYGSFDELLDYCRRSANPVGRLVLALFGYRDERRASWSDSICTALQLANHWQDVAVDLGKDRIYIPSDDLAKFGLDSEQLRERRADERFKRLMRFEVERARDLFNRGKPLCTSVSGRLGLELRAVWLGGMRVLKLIERNDYDVFARRPIITTGDKLRLLLPALSKEAFRRY